jgi:hypothetical protein
VEEVKMGVIAAAASETGPLSGQSHRSGFNFSLLTDSNGSIVLSAPTGYVFDIKQDVTGTDPTPVTNATNGTVVPGGKLQTNKNYYIANPQHATASFAVVLSQG